MHRSSHHRESLRYYYSGTVGLYVRPGEERQAERSRVTLGAARVPSRLRVSVRAIILMSLIYRQLHLMQVCLREEELGGSRAARQRGVMKCFNVITNAGGAAVCG